MIISTSHRFIFVHVPKTAGDSVTRALDPFAHPLKRTVWRSILRRLPNQSYFLTDATGRLVVDRMIRFEALSAEFSETMQSLGLGDVTIPHVNKTKSKSDKKPFQSYYDDRSIALVHKLYQSDFELLGYARDLPA